MFKKKQSLLLIDFDAIHGLILKWNIPRKQNPTFFRHILFYDVNNEFDVNSFSEKYFQGLKAGDMITFCCITEFGDFHQLKWREKSPLTQINVSRLKPSNSTHKQMALILQKLDESTEDFTEPIICNFVTQKDTKNLVEFQSIVKSWMGAKERFCSNIFGNFETSIEPMTGINYFSLEEFSRTDCDENWGFYKHYLNQISLFQIKITLQCQNGSFASKKDQWKNIDFNKITRVISAPSNNYIQDTIQFLNQDSSPQLNYTISVLLEFTQLDKHKFYASKTLIINTINEKAYQRTFAGRQIQFSTEVLPGFYSRKNPFRSDSLVWFKKTIDI